YLRSHVNDDPGTHNFEIDNRQALYRALGAYFFADDPSFGAVEIPSKEELKSAEELQVPLAAANAAFHTLALGLARQSASVWKSALAAASGTWSSSADFNSSFDGISTAPNEGSSAKK